MQDYERGRAEEDLQYKVINQKQYEATKKNIREYRAECKDELEKARRLRDEELYHE